MRWATADPQRLVTWLTDLGFAIASEAGMATAAAAAARAAAGSSAAGALDRAGALDLAGTLDLAGGSVTLLSEEGAPSVPGGRLSVAGRAFGSGDASRRAASAARSRPPHPNGLSTLLAVGWATVELERCAAGWPDLHFERVPGDELLGAGALAARGAGLVLLEPAREGRLAATLARHGEGACALYLRGAWDDLAQLERWWAERAVGVERAPGGPFGASVLVRGAVAGPHLLVAA